jgi:hypothetical protein
MQFSPTVAAPPKSIMCPITLEIMKDPVIVVSGESYERTAIETWFYSNNTLPLSNIVIIDKTLYPNRALKIYIEWWVAQNPQPITTVMDDFIPKIRQKPIPQSHRQLSLNLRRFLSSTHRMLSRNSSEFGTFTEIEIPLFGSSRRYSTVDIIPFGRGAFTPPTLRSDNSVGDRRSPEEFGPISNTILIES